MADNFLERQREDYERRKQAMMQQKSSTRKARRQCAVARPEDEAL